MIDIKDKSLCCGCGACMNICPKGAIKMISDEEGFRYPKIDSSKCIDCGLCNKVCPMLNSDKLFQDDPKVYAVKIKDEESRKNSTSGGMFTAISNYILSSGGVVYGATYDDNMKVVHSRLTDTKERDNAKGSKYVQSNIENIFEQVKKDLKDKIVLFTGTPCQNASLKQYLSKSDSLYLCDIVCHGVPSPLMWEERVKLLSKKGKVVDYYFRDKINGWHTHTEKVIYENKIDYKSNLSQMGKEIFYSHLILRPSCHTCPFTSIKRVSDITIGDFWGIDKVMPDFDDNKGVSLVLLNTKKGLELFNKVKNDLIVRESNTKDCLQPQLMYPSKPNPKREQFFKDYNKYGYEYVLKKYAVYGFKKESIQFVKRTIKTILPKKIVEKLKRNN